MTFDKAPKAMRTKKKTRRIREGFDEGDEMRREITKDERRNTMMKGRNTMTRGEGLSCEDDRDEG